MPDDLKINKTLVELIDGLPKPLPASAVQIEDALGVPLRVTSEQRDTAWYASRPFVTADGYRVTTVNLRAVSTSYQREHPDVGMLLALDFDASPCIPVAMLRERFGMDRPGGLVPDDPALSYRYADVPWGRFSLRIRTMLGGATCVDGVVLNNSRPPP
ncbi:hypothetical protein [Dyella terrae]|uniref:hypothetical protein n=1 Tax=Dyella terrae TaxID=522259 RepID=UPI001EFC5323|nr:hypothetical protein [Dyella terrae]